jgi:hypothetical protein
MRRRKKTMTVSYRVQCPTDKKHVFEKSFEVEEGTEHLESVTEAVCPVCSKMIEMTVKGKVVPNRSIFRGG